MQPPRLEAGALRKMASFRRNGTPVQAKATHDSKAGKEQARLTSRLHSAGRLAAVDQSALHASAAAGKHSSRAGRTSMMMPAMPSAGSRGTARSRSRGGPRALSAPRSSRVGARAATATAAAGGQLNAAGEFVGPLISPFSSRRTSRASSVTGRGEARGTNVAMRAHRRTKKGAGTSKGPR